MRELHLLNLGGGVRSTRLFVHRSCKPLVQIDFRAMIAGRSGSQRGVGFQEECDGTCGV